MKVDGAIYDTLLSITLILAAYKLFQTKENNDEEDFEEALTSGLTG